MPKNVYFKIGFNARIKDEVNYPPYTSEKKNTLKLTIWGLSTNELEQNIKPKLKMQRNWNDRNVIRKNVNMEDKYDFSCVSTSYNVYAE